MNTEPLINPWFIYLIGISENLREFLLPIALFAFAISAVLAIGNLIFFDIQDIFKKTKSYIFFFLILSILTGTLRAAIPDQKWMIALAVNSQITPQNIQITGDTVAKIKQDLSSDFFKLVDKIKEKKDEPKD